MKHWRRDGGKTFPVRLRILFGLIVLAVLLAVYAICIEPERLDIRRQTIELRQWPPELAGFTIAVVSDLHVLNTSAAEARLRRVVAETNALKPDLIVLLGDYIGPRYGGSLNATPATIAGIVSGLKARYGVFSVLGNHDWWGDGEAMAAALEERGIPVLENAVATLDIDGVRVNLLGLPDQETRSEVLGQGDRIETDCIGAILAQGVVKPDNDAPTIVLSHAPDFFADLALPYELTLSGHTHGGQVYIPFIGRPVVPSKYSDRYAIGLIEEDGRQLFVTAGVGTSILRIRFLCPPEIALLTLEPAPADAAGR